MSKKIYYDATLNKEVCDVSGLKSLTEIKLEFSLTEAVQTVEISDSDYAHEVVDGTLQTFNAKIRVEEQEATKALALLAQREALKTTMGWTDEQLNAILDLAKNS